VRYLRLFRIYCSVPRLFGRQHACCTFGRMNGIAWMLLNCFKFVMPACAPQSMRRHGTCYRIAKFFFIAVLRLLGLGVRRCNQPLIVLLISGQYTHVVHLV